MNARKELLETFKRIGKTSQDVIAYNILHAIDGVTWDEEMFMEVKGACPISDDILEKLDFEYDNGFGAQLLYGIVLFSDDSWLERHEYDGSECWVHKKAPTIEQVLNYKIEG